MAALANAGDLSLYLGRFIDPDAAELVLAGASGVVRAYCGWNLSQETTTFIVEGNGSVILSLPTLNLGAVTAIRIGGLPVDLLTAPAPIVHPRGQLIWAASWPAGALIEVDATHGYVDTPDVIRLVVLTLAARLLNNPDDARTASVGSVTRTYDTTLTALDMRLLDPFRL